MSGKSFDGVNPYLVREFARSALREDLGYQDVTTQACVDPNLVVEAKIWCKDPEVVVCGLDVAAEIFKVYDPNLEVVSAVAEGAYCSADRQAQRGDDLELVTIRGSARSVLAVERVVLNLMARMCGIATHTRALVAAMNTQDCQLLDTRKTMPMLKVFDKYAARVGGARNHRFGLSDGVLIKENHIAVCGGIAPAVRLARSRSPVSLKIEVEVGTVAECRQAYACGVDMIMLDNMTLSEMRSCVSMVGSGIPLEASGNITRQRIIEVAACGVDFISTSSMYKAPPADLSMLIGDDMGDIKNTT